MLTEGPNIVLLKVNSSTKLMINSKIETTTYIYNNKQKQLNDYRLFCF